MFERLISLIRKEKVSLFIGAGFSIEACAPSVSVLKKLILDEIYDNETKEKYNDAGLDALTNYFVEEVCCGSRNQLITILHKAFDFIPQCMTDHEMLSKIPHFKNIFTTNYDTLLEDSYRKEDCQVVRNDTDCSYIDKPFTIYKVHGDFNSPDSVVITSDDYSNFFSKKKKNPIMWNKVVSEFSEKHILFIGYSLEDDNILSIIRQVSNSLKKNQKDMFLIAPGISETKQAELKELKVNYYNTIASDFLTALIKELEENISSDFENKIISGETYTRFWNPYKAIPTVSMPQNGKNVVNEIKPLPGQQLQHILQMTLKKEDGIMLNEMDFIKYGQPNINPIYPHIPCVRIFGDNILNFKHIVNGVVLNNGIHDIIISPAEKEFDLSIRIPSRDFFELRTAKIYRLNSNTARFVVNCDAFIMPITLIVFPETGRATINIEFQFQKTYKDNNEAIKWIELVCAFFNNENVIFQELSMQPLNMQSAIQKVKDSHFEQIKQYYLDIKKIEFASRKKFKIYNECTEDSCRIARYIVSYLCREFLTIRSENKNGFDISTKSIVDDELLESMLKNEEITIVTTEHDMLSYRVNNRTFTIPYQHTILNSCQISNMIKDEQGLYSLDIHYPNATYSLLFSDKPACEEFPEMKPLHVAEEDKIANQ